MANIKLIVRQPFITPIGWRSIEATVMLILLNFIS